MTNSSVRFPEATQRLAIVGSTGSGKTQAGVFHLSMKDFHVRPWFIIDFKGDDLIGEIGAKVISVHAPPPKEPGIYIVRPHPTNDAQALIDFLMKCWEREDCGIYIDEGYMMGRTNPALIACLTQGRSKHIEMIVLSQRPTWMSRFVFSEADFFQVFRLNDRRDYDTIQSMISINIKEKLAPYYSHWYDVGADKGFKFGPVPSREALIETFNRRLKQRPRII